MSYNKYSTAGRPFIVQFIALPLVACASETPVPLHELPDNGSSLSQDDREAQVIEHLHNRGFDVSDAFFAESEEGDWLVVVESDMEFDADQLLSEALTPAASATEELTERDPQAYFDGGSATRQSLAQSGSATWEFDFDMSFDSNVPTSWRTAAAAAAAAWGSAAVGGKDIRIDFHGVVAAGIPTIHKRVSVQMATFYDPFPTVSSSPGASATIGVNSSRTIRINSNGTPRTADEKITLMLHELGHICGFRHNNQSSYYHVSGTYQASDPEWNSVMWPNSDGTGDWVTLPYQDRLAASYMFGVK